MARVRDTKVRAQRIELAYFKNRHWLRSARGWVGLFAFFLAAAWIGRYVFASHPTPASPGPVAAAHRMIGDQCERCHRDPVAPKDTRWLGASDDACRDCHRVSVHQPIERHTPPCASCHVEHRGAPALAAVATEQCTTCHADLESASTETPTLVASDAFHIAAFCDEHDGHPKENYGHQEFAIGGTKAAERKRLGSTPKPPSDASHIKFSHKVHLSKDLLGPDRTLFVQLVCADCHRGPFETASLHFAKRAPGVQPTTSAATTPDERPIEFAPAEAPQYFAPIRYAEHCAACHPHTFDPRIDAAPHDTPYVVRRFLEGAYARYAREKRKIRDPTARIHPIDEAEETSAASREKWAKNKVRWAENLLYRQECRSDRDCRMRCQQCHFLEAQQGAETPVVVPTAIPIRWLPQSRFDHARHRDVACRQCHDAADSTKATDVLMPKLETCQRCHAPDRASDRCAECHTYHGAMAPAQLDGPHEIPERSACTLNGSSACGGT